jgi:hypothetical protein
VAVSWKVGSGRIMAMLELQCGVLDKIMTKIVKHC